MTEDHLIACGARHIAARDPELARVISAVGTPELPRRRSRYEFLVGAFLSQQVSLQAARTIKARLLAAAGGFLTPERVSRLSEATLQACGISVQKRSYVRDLTERVSDGRTVLTGLHRLDDEAVIEKLVEVRGIGRWSAEMFLMFVLKRPDILPLGDLGLQNGFRHVYRLRARPGTSRMVKLAETWRPFRTVGCWYLWRSLEGRK